LKKFNGSKKKKTKSKTEVAFTGLLNQIPIFSDTTTPKEKDPRTYYQKLINMNTIVGYTIIEPRDKTKVFYITSIYVTVGMIGAPHLYFNMSDLDGNVEIRQLQISDTTPLIIQSPQPIIFDQGITFFTDVAGGTTIQILLVGYTLPK